MNLSRLFIALISVICTSCTSVSITDKNGDVRIERNIGLISVVAAPNTELISAKIESIGYVGSPLGHNFGYSNQVITISNDSCRIVIWVDDTTSTEELKAQLGSMGDVCFTK